MTNAGWKDEEVYKIGFSKKKKKKTATLNGNAK